MSDQNAIEIARALVRSCILFPLSLFRIVLLNEAQRLCFLSKRFVSKSLKLETKNVHFM